MSTTLINTVLETMNVSSLETEYINYMNYLSDELESGLEQPPLSGLDDSCRYFIHKQDNMDQMLLALHLAPMHQVLLRYAKYQPFYNELAAFLGSITLNDLNSFLQNQTQDFLSTIGSSVSQHEAIMHWATQQDSQRNRSLGKEINAFNERTGYGLMNIFAKVKDTYFFVSKTLFVNFFELYGIALLKEKNATQTTISKTLTEYSSPLSAFQSPQNTDGNFALPTEPQPTPTFTANSVADSVKTTEEPSNDIPADTTGGFHLIPFIVNIILTVHNFWKERFGLLLAVVYWVVIALLTLFSRPLSGLILFVLTYFAIHMFTRKNNND